MINQSATFAQISRGGGGGHKSLSRKIPINKLNLSPILNMSPDLKQVVKVHTRNNPDAILDVIVTNMAGLYEAPYTISPLDKDDDQPGEASDHNIVIMKPLSNISQPAQKQYKFIKYRPFPDSGLREFGRWIQVQKWSEIYKIPSVTEKAKLFEDIVMKKVESVFPQKVIKIHRNDKPWVDTELQNLDRQRKREYNLRKKSKKWISLNEKFKKRAQELKKAYNENVVKDLKESNIWQWYSKLKRMSATENVKDDHVHVEELSGVHAKDQVEIIANKFAEISAQYDPLNRENIVMPNPDPSSPPPLFEPYHVYQKIKEMKKKSSTVHGDLPWRLIREFAVEMSEPLCHIYNSATLDGEWPTHWKHEYITPVPKVYPPQTVDDLRRISGTKNLSKLYEALLSETIVRDIASSIDPCQFGNEKGLSTTHYLVKMINQILTILDTNNEQEKYAVIAQFIDWSKAFDRQDATLGIQNFIKSGVRPSLIPTLISFFEDRTMTVKWNGSISVPRDLPGGVPQGSTFGGLSYKVNSNDNANHVQENMRFKFVDDLSTLEKLNLISVGLSSYNFKFHVASDIEIGNQFLPEKSFKGQESLDQLVEWTNVNRSKLNVKKSNYMIFNFTREYQFNCRLKIEDTLLEAIEETKLLGMIITSDLKWQKNTDMLVRKGFQRMRMIQKLKSFDINRNDLVTIYILYIRSILEQNCQVWHYSLTEEEVMNLERVQKAACHIILQNDYISYQDALNTLTLETLFDRREALCLKFAEKCTKHSKAKQLFPLNPEVKHHLRNREKYLVQPAKTDRLLHSSIPQLQRALNATSK